MSDLALKNLANISMEGVLGLLLVCSEPNFDSDFLVSSL